MLPRKQFVRSVILERAYLRLAGEPEPSRVPKSKRWSMPQSLRLVSYRKEGEFYQDTPTGLAERIDPNRAYLIKRKDGVGKLYTRTVRGSTLIGMLELFKERRLEILSGPIQKPEEESPYAAHLERVAKLPQKEKDRLTASVMSAGQRRQDREDSDLTRGLHGKWRP